uniref:MARVEL domain-containing protein n=1 Tax=Bionectria ochroleuca TaxID=29856 RepID=A0A8H7MYZ1_BIOOC
MLFRRSHAGETTPTGRTRRSPLRPLISLNHFMVFASAAIVTGITAYFVHLEPKPHSTHIIYQLVIAVITLILYAISSILPFIKRYRGHFMPVNLILSYLWLTSFIFASQDWAGGRCVRNSTVAGRCSLKKTIIAFDFLALFFLMCNVVAEGFLLRQERTGAVVDPAVEPKHRPDTATTANTTNVV